MLILNVLKACTSWCNQGLRRCFLQIFNEACCNFYLENECVNNCSSPLVPNNTTFDCGELYYYYYHQVCGSYTVCICLCMYTECPPLILGNGTLSPPEAVAINSTVAHICNHGYSLLGAETLTCSRNGWNSESPMCGKVLMCVCACDHAIARSIHERA